MDGCQALRNARAIIGDGLVTIGTYHTKINKHRQCTKTLRSIRRFQGRAGHVERKFHAGHFGHVNEGRSDSAEEFRTHEIG